MCKKITKKKRLLIIGFVLVVIPMVVGAILYYLFCPNVWFVKLIDDYVCKVDRPSIDLMAHPFLRFGRCYAFDFIWAFSMTNAMCLFYSNNATPHITCFVITVILGIGMEILQFWGVAQGTFDLWDVVAEGLASVLGVIITNIFRRIIYEEN